MGVIITCIISGLLIGVVLSLLGVPSQVVCVIVALVAGYSFTKL